jgi:hypothetical protein
MLQLETMLLVGEVNQDICKQYRELSASSLMIAVSYVFRQEQIHHCATGISNRAKHDTRSQLSFFHKSNV